MARTQKTTAIRVWSIRTACTTTGRQVRLLQVLVGNKALLRKATQAMSGWISNWKTRIEKKNSSYSRRRRSRKSSTTAGHSGFVASGRIGSLKSSKRAERRPQETAISARILVRSGGGLPPPLPPCRSPPRRPPPPKIPPPKPIPAPPNGCSLPPPNVPPLETSRPRRPPPPLVGRAPSTSSSSTASSSKPTLRRRRHINCEVNINSIDHLEQPNKKFARLYREFIWSTSHSHFRSKLCDRKTVAEDVNLIEPSLIGGNGMRNYEAAVPTKCTIFVRLAANFTKKVRRFVFWTVNAKCRSKSALPT
ncbi:unnamed protein product [Nesidiocoris tenuis]|uniref:Uncharacterized protein n=1 Tax=Nesidiocoris tenuis TaxID=355587 RepID=A0A6H5HEK3_9HEMI|nr:unnamed protein product [Nesidiocoris tenuis]